MNFEVPVILLKRLVILPNQEIKIELNNINSGNTINKAINNYKGQILVVAPIDELEEEPGVSDLPMVGVIAKIKNKIEVDKNIQVRLRGVKRVAVNKYFNKLDDILYSDVLYIDLPSLVEEEETAILKKLVSVLKEFINISDNVSNDILSYITTNKNLDKTTDAIASFLPLSLVKKLEYMQEINPIKRAKSLIKDMNEAIKSIEFDNELDSMVEEAISTEQKNFLLKEKLKVIKQELKEESWKDTEVNYFKEKLNKLKLNKDTFNHITRELEKYEIMSDTSPEVSMMHNYLDWIINLPWNKSTKDITDYDTVYNTLNKSHYGLEEIKKRISEYVAIKKINKNIKSPIICLVGPPGVGKTSIATSIADALNRKFYKISVGGLNDSTELVGTRRTYIASSPGKIIQGINKCGSNNPVILIDEVDKMVKDYKGDPASTLLEILDPVQNKFFTDSYIEEPFDLSNVLFILTANVKENIPSALIDRVEIIELNSYTIFEKKDIAKKYLLPEILSDNMVNKEKIRFSDELLYFLINGYTYEAGVRDLKRVLESISRKITINNIKSLNKEKIIKLLGNPLYKNELTENNKFGVVNTLAYTPVGGCVTKLEVISFKGNGQVIITGNVGDIMKESVQVVMSMLKTNFKYNFNNLDFHFHFLDGSSKKEGPSAGVSIGVALVSQIEEKIINSDIAFTGELSLNGNILKIGGLKEKLIGAYNNNVKVVYIPSSNIDDLKDVPEEIRNNMQIIPVNDFKEIYTNIFK